MGGAVFVLAKYKPSSAPSFCGSNIDIVARSFFITLQFIGGHYGPIMMMMRNVNRSILIPKFTIDVIKLARLPINHLIYSPAHFQVLARLTYFSSRPLEAGVCLERATVCEMCHLFYQSI